MSSVDSKVIGMLEAEQQFSQLVSRVIGGEEITITQHGAPVVRLVPVKRASTQEARAEAIRQMRELASSNRLNGLSVKDLIAEGRK